MIHEQGALPSPNCESSCTSRRRQFCQSEKVLNFSNANQDIPSICSTNGNHLSFCAFKLIWLADNTNKTFYIFSQILHFTRVKLSTKPSQTNWTVTCGENKCCSLRCISNNMYHACSSLHNFKRNRCHFYSYLTTYLVILFCESESKSVILLN